MRSISFNKYLPFYVAIILICLSPSILLAAKVSALPAPNGCYQHINPGPSSNGGYEQLTNDACSSGNVYPGTGNPDPTSHCYVEGTALNGQPVWSLTDCETISQGGILNPGAVNNGNATATYQGYKPAVGDYGHACDFGKTLFGLPVWYEYLQKYEKTDSGGACSFDLSKSTVDSNGNPTTNIGDTSALVLIGLAIIDILLRLIGVIAVIFVIVGGVRYVTSQGEPDKTKQAQATIRNALIGMAIAIVASGLVAFVGSNLGR